MDSLSTEDGCQRISINLTTIKIKNRLLLEVFFTEETHIQNIAKIIFLFLIRIELPGQNNFQSSHNFLTKLRLEASWSELLTLMRMLELLCQMLNQPKNCNNSPLHPKDILLMNNSGKF